MNKKYRFIVGGYGIVIEHEKPFSKFIALRKLNKYLRNPKVKINLAE